MPPPRKNIGERVRDLRERHGLAPDDLARRLAGDHADDAVVARHREDVLALENTGRLPSVKILLQIARVFGKRLGHLTDDLSDDGIVVGRAAELTGARRVPGSNLGSNSEEMAWYFLAGAKAGRHMEPALIDLQPRRDPPRLEGHEAEEFIYVVSGRLEIVHGVSRYELFPGDSIAYGAHIPHHVHAAGDGPARIVAVFFGHMKTDPSVVRAEPRRRVNPAHGGVDGADAAVGGISYYSAAVYRPESVQAHVAEIGPDEIPRRENRHEGEEFTYVLSGRLELYYGKSKYELSAGDSAYYDSAVRHRRVRVGSEVARALSIVYNPA